jgi:site-specific DNA recombinase
MKTAVLYLRVSTTGQVNTDYDPEGISIPAQRLACQRKVAQLGVTIVGEYVEPGRSATNMDKRPVFQQMLQDLREDPVDHVIVYNLSRLNRNRVDDARVLMELRARKVTLISAQENIDETPSGQLMHGVLAAINEYRSSSDGADIRYKMGQKAKNGGTLGRAPVGYMNVRERFEGREIRTVAVDPERGPLVTQAFELYATGDYSIDRLVEAMTRRGLTRRPIGRAPAGPVSPSAMHRLLREPYYLGRVTYDGVEYEGRHQALVKPDVFVRVQTVLEARSTAQERQRVHDHYLKGTIFCRRCFARGEKRRMLLQRTVGRHGGVYFYFFCRGRQMGECDAPHISIEAVEQHVLDHYRSIQLPRGFTDRVRAILDETLENEERGSRLMRQQLDTQLSKLDKREENLLDLAAEGEVPKAKLLARLVKIKEERASVTEAMSTVDTRLAAGAEVLRAGLDLLDRLPDLYRQLDPLSRRLLNQALFTGLFIERDLPTEEQLAEPFDELLFMRRRSTIARAYKRSRPKQRGGSLVGAASVASTSTGLLESALCGRGSSKNPLVELRGLEPLTPTLPGRT